MQVQSHLNVAVNQHLEGTAPKPPILLCIENQLKASAGLFKRYQEASIEEISARDVVGIGQICLSYDRLRRIKSAAQFILGLVDEST